jgi:hypothetical protein
MTKKTEKPYTTEDFEKNIQIMKDEDLPMTAPIEVTIEGDDNVYHIESLGHFHVIPNMTIHLKLKSIYED